MNVSCPKCETEFRVDPAKVPVRGVRARCSTCSAVFFVGRPAEAEPVAAPLPPTATVSSPPGSSAPASPEPVSAVPPSRPSYSAPPPVPRQPAGPAPARPPMAPPAGAGLRPTQSSPAATPASAPPPPAMGSRAPGYAPSPIPAANVPGFPPAPPAGSRPASPPPGSPSAAAPTPAPAPPRRPVNPFLATDPSTKARRLARALISDLVVYHPGKRADGLRDGTLKLLFEDEIRKCWEEYSEQVGMEMATSTPYFTEALNEILADGQPVFS